MLSNLIPDREGYGGATPAIRTLRQVLPVPRSAKAWRVNPRPGTSFTYKGRTGPHGDKENA